MIAPESFQQAIRSFDPLMAVRAGKALSGKWVVERKAYIGPEEVYFLRRRRDRAFRVANNKLDAKERSRTLDLARQIAEETDCAERGCRVVVFVDKLDNRVFDMLVMSDIRRYGGFSRWMAEYEAAEQRHEKDQERQAANEREATHKDAFDKLNFVWNHREAQLLAGE